MDHSESVMEAGLQIVRSFEKSAAALIDLVKETAGCLEEECSEQDAMLRELRDKLSREGLRKKDFDAIMGRLQTRAGELRGEIKTAIEAFLREEGEFVRFLESMVNGTSETTGYLGSERLPKLRECEHRVAAVLMELQIEQATLNGELKRLLSIREGVSIKDFKFSVRTLKLRQDESRGAMGRVIEDFYRARQDVLARWQAAFSACNG